MADLVNLTPHPINIYDSEIMEVILTVEPSGYSVRIEETITPHDDLIVDNIVIETVKMKFDESKLYLLSNDDIKNRVANPMRHDMYNKVDGTLYIVSAMVKDLRDDFVAIGKAVRNEKGHTIGCIGLSV